MAINLDDIKYFLHVTETLNITRASERAGVTQPTMSYSIKRLEKEVGGDLLVRLKSGVQLTKFGEEFALRSRELALNWQQLENLVSGKDGEVTGKYSIGIHPSVALYTLEHFLPQLKVSYPKIDFSLIHGLSREITEKVIDWKVDFGIVVNPKKHPDLVIKELCKDKVMLYGDKENSDLLISDSNLMQTEAVLKKIDKSKHKFNRHLTSENLEVVARLVAIGHGVGILPTRVAMQYEGLKPIDKSLFFEDSVCLIYRPEKRKDMAGKKIIDYISKIKI